MSLPACRIVLALPDRRGRPRLRGDRRLRERRAGGRRAEAADRLGQQAAGPAGRRLRRRTRAGPRRWRPSRSGPGSRATSRRSASRPGDLVEAGQVLFVIDPRQYEDAVELAAARLEQAEAEARLAAVERDRYRQLARRDAGSRQDFDRAAARYDVAVAEAERRRRPTSTAPKLDLSFTEVTSPIAGQASSHFVDVGNLHHRRPAESNLLTTVVVGRPDLRLLRRRRASRSLQLPEDRLRAPGRGRRADQDPRGRDPGRDGPGRRGRLPARRHARLRRQPDRPGHRDPPGPGGLPQPRPPAHPRPLRPRPHPDQRAERRRPRRRDRPSAPTRASASPTSSTTRTASSAGSSPSGRSIAGMQVIERGARARRPGDRQRHPAGPRGDRRRPAGGARCPCPRAPRRRWPPPSPRPAASRPPCPIPRRPSAPPRPPGWTSRPPTRRSTSTAGRARCRTAGRARRREPRAGS